MLRKIAWRKISLIFLVTGLVGAQQEIIFSESTVFRLFIEQGVFNNAKQRCESLTQLNSNFEFSLARVDSREQFDFIAEGFNFADITLPNTIVDNVQRQGIWIGIERTRDIAGVTASTDDFSFVDGVETNRSFFEAPNDFPWDHSQPNNLDFQNCVSWELLPLPGSAGLNTPIRWYDDDCVAFMSAFLCRGEVLPTPAPTREPTTPKPTEAPSKSPSLSPTEAPSDSSSSSPTIAASPDEQDNLRSTIFLSLAGVSGSLMLLSLVILVRKKRDLKSVQQALHDREKLSELALADEKEGAMY